MKNLVYFIVFVLAVTSIFVMIGWFYDISSLKSIFPGFVNMQFLTAFSFLLSALIIFATIQYETNNRQVATILLATSVLVLMLIMGSLFFGAVLNAETGIEKIFAEETVSSLLLNRSPKPSIGTMLSFVIIGIMAFIALGGLRNRGKFFLFGGILLLVISGISFVGYLIGEPSLYYLIEGVSDGMAIHTTFLFFLSGISYIAIAALLLRKAINEA